MADVTISGLPNEAASATVDGDVDWMEIDDVSAVETKRVHPRALLIGLTGASVGAVGKDILTQGGLGGPGDGGTPGGTGGDGVVDAGPGGGDGGAGAGAAGVVSIGETNASAIRSGVGLTSLWTHAGVMKVLAQMSASSGTIAAPGAAFTADLGVGLRLPAPKQLGLVAFNEEVVVDNAGATPALRPDVDNVWNCGTATKAWLVVSCHTLQALTRVLAPSGSVGSPAVDVGGSGGLFVPLSNQVGIAANSKAVIVDNDSATPSFRPDADDAWTSGEEGFGWKAIFADALSIPGSNARTAISGTVAAGTLVHFNEYSAAAKLTYAQRFGLTLDGEVAHDFKCEVNQPIGTEGYTAFKLVITETLLGSGTKNAMQVLAGVAGGTELLALDNDGVLRPAGSVVRIHDEDEVTGQTTVSATLEDIPGLTFDLTTPVAGRILAEMSMGSSSSGSGVVGAWAISIDSVDQTEIPRELSGVTDNGMGSVKGWADLSAGTYTVKGRHRRVSGGSTVNTDVAQLVAQFYPD